MNIFHLIINIIVGIFIITSIFVMFTIVMEYLEDWLGVKHEDKTHHDNRPGSHYRISSNALRETRKEKYGS
jgi:hypothetical protein